MSTLAVYPGSFDPVTHGHIDIARRASALFGRLIVAVSDNPQKRHAFPVEERVRLIRENLRGLRGVTVDSFSGLLVDFMRERRARTVIRGLRAVSDLEYEFQLASTNRGLYAELETVFMMPDEKYTYLSSSMVREVASLGGGLGRMVPPNVVAALRRRYPGR